MRGFESVAVGLIHIAEQEIQFPRPLRPLRVFRGVKTELSNQIGTCGLGDEKIEKGQTLLRSKTDARLESE